MVTELGNIPTLIYQTKRNMQSVLTPDEAQAWLEQYDRNKGVIFYVDDDFKITNVVRVAKEML